jgi:predicted MFS family arabinose efflux permease
VFARDVLFVGGTGLGVLMAASGLGAVCGALFVAARGSKMDRHRVMLIGLVCFGASLIVFAVSPWLWVSAGMLTAAGFSQQVYMALNNTLIQEDVDPEYRGRVVSTLFLNRGFVPMGTILAGFGSDAFGAPVTVSAMAGVLVLLAVVAARLRPEESPARAGA